MKYSIILFFTFLSGIVNSQNFVINFAGRGEKTTVENITVENITKGTSVVLKGTDQLYVTDEGLSMPILNSTEKELHIYPMPMLDISTIEFYTPYSGNARIDIIDISGKIINSLQQDLNIGVHSIKVSDLISGVYVISITSDNYSYKGKLISNSNSKGNGLITYNYNYSKISQAQKKKEKSAVVMQYNNGDVLRFIGISGRCKTIVVKKIEKDETITFDFYECLDKDGNNYTIVRIGNQLWTAENFKSTKYNDDFAISNVTDNSAWKNLITGAYCDYDNKIENSAIYGRLYNWYAVNSETFSPEGWHVPTLLDYTTLIGYLEGKDVAIGKLKEPGVLHWQSPNIVSSLVTGFDALPSGYRSCYDGSFSYLGELCRMWSTTADPAFNAQYIYQITLSSIDNLASVNYTEKSNGLSVRLVKDCSTPLLYTNKILSCNHNSAFGGGEITSEGNSPVIKRGICWSTNELPTVKNDYTVDGSGVGIFNSTISGLQKNTQYYVRAYAINNTDTVYGNQYVFKTHDNVSSGITFNSNKNYGTMTDIDGNIYKTITIGNQTWMAENLRTIRYNDGTDIPYVQNYIDDEGNQAWVGVNTGAFCTHKNTIDGDTITTYGRLYNYLAINTGKLAPAGWHVPTDAEWQTLFDNLGGEEVASNNMRETGTVHWYTPNASATNSSGFSAVPAGEIWTAGFSDMGNYSTWWSSSEDTQFTDQAYTRVISKIENFCCSQGSLSKNYGCSVRLIKD